MVDVHYSDSVTYTYADTRERERERDRGSSVHVDLEEVRAKRNQAFAPRARLDGIVPVGGRLLPTRMVQYGITAITPLQLGYF